ncbi:DinB family protein [Virgibacillus litoralis]|uniref:Damage-inducible protein DinB n=1 Tax=Virgibacillus litoralis TaxID=578221 RepID=A0ABS4HIW7_9BACI|nr:DinB family protein [Virgibacillus litoralis]MBP1950865.1 putative damage-inducible protein DinB [Virgibacillus litoralis]
MNELMYTQFDKTRKSFLKKIDGLDKDLADIQPAGFNNTIHWHIGHVLTVTEQVLFGFPSKYQHLPAHYKELFAYGTNPADWSDDVPSVEELISQLTDQLDRIKEIPPEKFNETLPKPMMGNETYGELAVMTTYHEANHLGQIHAMERVIDNK